MFHRSAVGHGGKCLRRCKAYNKRRRTYKGLATVLVVGNGGFKNLF
jgi:hypothetical protein